MSEKTNSYILIVEARIDGEDKMFQFDYVEDTTTQLTSDITTHPIVNGDIVADHMYRNPISENVSGKFSLFGNKRYNYGTSDRLANIQTIFERIKDEGIFCKLYKMNQNTGDKTRFKIRENMILKSITWIESQTVLTFTFEFVEAMTVNIEEVQYDVDVTDENLPALTDATTSDFTDEFLNMNTVTKYVIKILTDEELLKGDFLEYFVKTYSAGLGTGTVAGVVVGLAAIKTIVTVCGSIAAATPVGTTIAIGLGAVAFVAITWYSAYKGLKKFANSRKYKLKAFKTYKSDKKNKAEAVRFTNYVGTIYQNLEYLNESISIYGIPKNGNQELLTYIDNVYYIFSFIKNNATGKYDLRINTLDSENSERFNKPNISSYCCSLLSTCGAKTMLFKTDGTGSQVFLINKELGNYITASNVSKEKIEEITSDLTKYCILVSKIDMDKFNNTLYEIIKNSMTM